MPIAGYVTEELGTLSCSGKSKLTSKKLETAFRSLFTANRGPGIPAGVSRFIQVVAYQLVWVDSFAALPRESSSTSAILSPVSPSAAPDHSSAVYLSIVYCSFVFQRFLMFSDIHFLTRVSTAMLI